MRSTTPNAINGSVLELVRHIPGAEIPIFLDLEPDPKAAKLDCFGNVRRRIESDGGTIKYGWCVWLWDGRMVEGEFHAVWQSPSGTLHDITPKPDGEHRILFIPDSRSTYNYEPVDNVRVALSKDSEVLALIEAGRRMTELRKLYNDGTGKSQIPLSAFMKQPPTTVPTSTLKPGRNDPCPCGSGRKYKKCCL